MALCQFTCSSWSKTNSCRCTAMSVHYLSLSCQKNKKKQTYMNDFSNKALMTFNHDAPTVSFQALISLSSWYVLFQ